MAKAKAPPKRKVNGYKMPDPIPQGEILQDVFKKQWRVGTSIGKGGFGEIYSAQEAEARGSSYPYVVKIEPHENGPLFVEMHFYTRNGKKADIDAYKKENKLKDLGMPALLGSGSHEFKGQKYRFIVMQKFGSDIWKLFLSNNKKFPAATAYRLGLQVIDVLEYIHSRGYVHADIKGANILLDETDQSRVYLVDFGLAGRYTSETVFKPNPKKMHDGTIEYLSRDAHQGVPTRRGDVEILAYNMIHWLGCTLPWEKDLTNPKIVEESKKKYMSDVKLFMKTAFKNTPPDGIVKLVEYVNAMEFNSCPDYDKIRDLFCTELKLQGGKESGLLQFKSAQKRKSDILTPAKKDRKNTKMTVNGDDSKENVSLDSEDSDEVPLAQINGVKKRTGRPAKLKKTGRSSKLKNCSDNDSVEEKTPKKIKGRGKKVVNSNVEENKELVKPFAETTEMKRIRQKMLDKKLKAKTVLKKKHRKHNIESNSESEVEEEEGAPVTKRAARK